MAFALLSKSQSKTQGSVKPVPKQKSARGQRPADSRIGFAKPVFQPPATALPTAPVIQTKLKVGEPDDKFEQEADRVAELMENGNSLISPSAAAQSRGPAGGLQHLYGNQPVLQMRNGSGGLPAPSVPLRPSQGGILQRKCACGGAAGMSGECEECSKKKRFGLQTKLKVNEPGDIYEQEADRIADQVMATPAHHAVSGAPPRIQRFAGQPTGQTDAAPASVDQALASPGRPLDPALWQDMEQRFGYDFSRVRVHTGAAAEQSAQDIDADAYSVGRDVVFGAGQYAPGTTAGDRLIAHELAHVVQQGHSTGMLQRSPRRQGRARDKLTSIDPKTARLVMELIMTIIAKIEANPTHPSRWASDPSISKYRELLSLWFELTYGKKADGSKLEGEEFASAFERANAETTPIFQASLQGAPTSFRQVVSDRWYPNFFELEKRAASERRIAKLVETTTSFRLPSPEPISFDEFLRVASANNSRSPVLQRGAGIKVGRAVPGFTYYASQDEPRLVLWASSEGVFFLLGDQIYKQSIAGFSDDIILGALIKAAQDVGPFVNLITAVVDIAISLTPVGVVYDLTMASKAIAQGNWRDAALELLPGPALNKATKLAKATRIGRAAFRGGAKGAKLLGKAISGTASFVGRGIGKVRGKAKPGLWLVAEEVGEAGATKGYHFLGEGEDVWRAVPDTEAEQFIRCSTCRWTPSGKDLRTAEAEVSAAERELVGGGFIEGPAKATRPGRVPKTGFGEKARREFEKVRDGYAKRLGVPSGGQVHHGIELQVLDRYPGVYTAKELNAFENMRGIGTEQARRQQLHQSKVREIWDRHYARMDKEIAAAGLKPGTAKYSEYVKRNLQDGRDEIDYVLGQFFTEYRTGKPRSFR
jgi:Domain of unknown function (DUF4157)